MATAYGWPADLSDDAILERLLALNLAYAADERAHPVGSAPKVSCAKSDEEL